VSSVVFGKKKRSWKKGWNREVFLRVDLTENGDPPTVKREKQKAPHEKRGGKKR